MSTLRSRPRPASAGRSAVLRATLFATGLLAGSALAAGSPEWLSSTDGPSPIVTSKSGVGSAQATATGKVTSDSIKELCSDQAGLGDPAQAKKATDGCAKQWKGELGKTYTVKADCTVGRLDPLDGKSYVLDGIWDNTDVGGGRTRWRGPDGVVGRDNASGGLALSQQWEVLCPGRVSAATLSKARSLGGTGGGGAAASAPAATASVCGGDASCTEVNAFAMSVVEFRASLQGGWKILTTTLRFRNKLNRPLVLGYVVGSGGATDDRGNRYAVKDVETRGIGLISGRADDKFVIAPGQTGDARFTLFWGGQGLFGSTFDLDLTVREITQMGQGQTTLGPEYPLQIVGLVDGARSAGPGVAQAGGAAAAPATSATPATPDAQPDPGTPAHSAPSTPLGIPPTTTAGNARCSPGTSCQDAGSFTVTMTQSAAAASGKTQMARIGLRVQNKTAQPVVLAYKSGTNAAVDEQGNRYSWGRAGTPDGSAQGIGMLDGARIDPRFQVGASGTRDLQMMLTRSDASTRPAGKSFTIDTVLVELKAAPGGQWQKVREVPVHLGAPAGPGVVPSVGQTQAPDNVQKASDLLRGLLGK
ncbi:MAG TPA: hypothetical protein VFI53_17380 [Myxococcaceae bacterium]|nr:hypothetical protein [Myxococcaceae bacterium]